MVRGYSRSCKSGRDISKLLGTLNIIFTASELEPASVPSSTFPVWFRTFKKEIINAFKIWKWSIPPNKADFSHYFSSSYTLAIPYALNNVTIFIRYE